jgi:aminoglycoside phosphotransferase (APT) family kinase protein
MDPDLESAIRELLGPGNWSIDPAADGSRGRSWVARDAGEQLFVKAAANGDLLSRLGELAVAPRVISSGQHRDTALVVQEFIDGTAPDAPWVDQHVEAVGQLIQRYHLDEPLALSVSALTLRNLVETLERRFHALSMRMTTDTREKLSEALGAITESAVDKAPDEPVLTHGDPNTSNLILANSGDLYLVDWDEARLTDPVRDIGQVLWWYVRPERWKAGLAACGLPDNPSVRHRIYRWAAAESAEVAIGLLEESNEGASTVFASDALAAAHGEPNPRAWWLAT